MDDATGQPHTLPSPGQPPASSVGGGALAARYEVRARLGRGATKEVYLAYDRRLDREVALAIVVGAAAGDAAARARVTREAQVTGRLGDHPNIITVYDSGEQDGVPYLVLRAMRGGSLAELLERERPSFAEAIRLGGEIASALAHAHAHGVVHRDVKPDNVWLAADGSAALGDFGIAHQSGLDRLTTDGVVVGTVRYLSPEQIRGDEIGPAGDLYALGVTLYELVTGRPPFVAADATQVLTQHLTAVPVAPSQLEPAIPPALDRLILGLLAKHPARRPASAAEIARALAAIAPPADDRARAGAGPASPTRPPAAAAAGPPALPGPVAVAVPSPARRHDARRVVSVLAVGSNVADPEALHGVFDRCTTVIERHGGTVERYLGDALVGIFGLTESHGDDALRAARAALDLRAMASELRLGVETGEVFLATDPRGATIATGSPIGSAARLAERALPGDIMLGGAVRDAVGGAATIDIETGRLLELHVEQPALLRAPATPFVGRTDELDALRAAFARARDERACHLVTVLGAPGIGKSRLAGEFLTALGDEATVLAGSCVAYGEGTAYRAIAEIVRGLGGDPRRRVEELLVGDEQAVRGILGAIGLSDEPAQAEETAWAVRVLFERLARERPVVVAVEDIHWATPSLLDVLDHVVALSSGSPILLVCLARPELLASRPAWDVASGNRSRVRLDALDDAQSRDLAELLGAPQLAARIAQRAEGNPLFVEQLVAVDAGHDDVELPASIQAVLAARIDRLQGGERLLLQHAAVEGRTFHAGLLVALLSDHEQATIAAHLVALAREGLIGAERPEFAGEEAFRFTHALIREAAYAGAPKLLRATLHEGVADWLGARSAPDEILGFHLEQACRLATELGRAGERETALARRAARRLEAASRGALARGDPDGSTALLERAVVLVDGDEPTRVALLPALGASLFEAGRMNEAAGVLDEAIVTTSDTRIHARAQVEREIVRLEIEPSFATEQALDVADAALSVFDGAGDVHGRCRAWSLRAHVAWNAGHVERADDAWREAADCARLLGDEREVYDALGWRATAAVLGPTPVDDAIRACEELRGVVAASPVAVAWIVNPLASLHAMRGEFERAEDCLREANEILRRLGGLGASVSHHEALVRLLAGQPELAEPPLRAGVDKLEPMAGGGALPTTTAMLAQAVYAQGRMGEAGELCDVTAATAVADDIVTQVIWRSVRAKILARESRTDEAEALAREAVALVAPTDLLSHHADALLDLAEVLRACDRLAPADEAIHSAIALYERKGNIASGRRARSLLRPPRAG